VSLLTFGVDERLDAVVADDVLVLRVKHLCPGRVTFSSRLCSASSVSPTETVSSNRTGSGGAGSVPPTNRLPVPSAAVSITAIRTIFRDGQYTGAVRTWRKKRLWSTTRKLSPAAVPDCRPHIVQQSSGPAWHGVTTAIVRTDRNRGGGSGAGNRLSQRVGEPGRSRGARRRNEHEFPFARATTSFGDAPGQEPAEPAVTARVDEDRRPGPAVAEALDIASPTFNQHFRKRNERCSTRYCRAPNGTGRRTEVCCIRPRCSWPPADSSLAARRQCLRNWPASPSSPMERRRSAESSISRRREPASSDVCKGLPPARLPTGAHGDCW